MPEVSSIPLQQTGSIGPWLLLKLTGPSQHWGDLSGLCGTWWAYVAAVQHAQSRQQEKGVRTLLCLFSLLSIFNYASFDNCCGIPWAPVVISLPRMTGICLINQRSVHSAGYQQATAQHRANLLVSWDARPFPGSDANLVSSGVIFSAALLSNSTPSFTIAVAVEEASVVAFFYRWDSGTCLLTRWRHGLSMSGGCQLPQQARPPHLALISAGGYALAEWLSDAQTISGP